MSDDRGPGGGDRSGGRGPDGGQPPDRRGAGTGPHLRVVPDAGYAGWDEIYRDNVERVYRIMFAKVGNRADAEDLTAEVFMTALRPLRVSASVGEVRAYLLATARTVLAGYWRRTLGLPVTTLDEERVETAFADRDDDAEAIARAEAILRALPPRHERILRLRFLQACSVRDAATELGVTVSNAKVLQHRALRQAAEVARRMAL
ncbi:RNA polymerase sigma factor [Pseudofrankia inefficax]|uniref:RNA polymerase, sigma-24 subunit, ECF subfamily n=1 Tax=Pseudofrankia inefficax (strain DSM 45817 / CECT 9037 / DDB 130130 / EuI1c) TaxID=298654 RepID=E3J580_PSEI1|nr:sigma-70 family RNA polymerase sigma factor [Pseudofrankia inefficax]ADP80678.1 RNA polymerase, sigma-24 subunit, ECF subfamily [Pseudofrankia inefficax]